MKKTSKHSTDLELPVSFEEKIWGIWNKNKNFVYGLVLIVLAVAGGAQGMRIWKEKRNEAMQTAFLDAIASNNLKSFTHEYPSGPLTGVAYINLADSAYEKADYTLALDYYKNAFKLLGQTTLGQRAQLGQALANICLKETSSGEALLESIAKNSKYLDVSRAEAAYHLAALANASGNTEAISTYAALMDQLEFPGLWKQKLALLNRNS